MKESNALDHLDYFEGIRYANKMGRGMAQPPEGIAAAPKPETFVDFTLRFMKEHGDFVDEHDVEDVASYPFRYLVDTWRSGSAGKVRSYVKQAEALRKQWITYCINSDDSLSREEKVWYHRVPADYFPKELTGSPVDRDWSEGGKKEVWRCSVAMGMVYALDTAFNNAWDARFPKMEISDRLNDIIDERGEI